MVSDDDAMRLGRNIQDINERLQQFERAFQDHANYLQKLEAKVNALQQGVVISFDEPCQDAQDKSGDWMDRLQPKGRFWMGEANTRLGGG